MKTQAYQEATDESNSWAGLFLLYTVLGGSSWAGWRGVVI